MRIVIAVILFALAGFTMMGHRDGYRPISFLTLLLVLGGAAVTLSHFRPLQK